MYSKELIAASTVPFILTILSGGRSYGYLIIKKVKEISSGEIEFSEAMLYPVLKRMERDKLIKSKWILSEEGRHRKYYDITEAGKKALHQRKQQWNRLHNVLNEMWAAS